MVACRRPMATYGTILPVITSSGSTGVASRFSIVPRSRSRVIASPVIMTIVMVRITPMRPGTTLYCVIALGVVEPVDLHVERRRAAARARPAGPPGPSATQTARSRAARRAPPSTAVGSVASASIKQRGTLAAQQLAREAGRDIEHEQHACPRASSASRRPRRSAASSTTSK